MTERTRTRVRPSLAADTPFRPRTRRYDVSGIYTGPCAAELADFMQEDTSIYEGGPLADERARMLLASAAFAVLKYADRYDAIVGEDTSGRYPALIVGGAMNDIREAHGLPPARRLFVSGRIDERRSPVGWQLAHDDKALVVTEYVAGGASTHTIHELLKHQTQTAPDYLVLGGMPETCARRDRYKSVRRESLVFTGHETCDTAQADTRFAVGATANWKGVYKHFGDAHSRPEARRNRGNLLASRREAELFRAALVNYYLEVTKESPAL